MALFRWLNRIPSAAVAGLWLLFVVGLSLLSQRYIAFIEVAENWAADWMVTLFEPFAPQHPDIIVLAITENTLSRFPFRSPVDRKFLADTLDMLAARGVKAVGMDLLFDQPTVPAADEAFRAAAQRFPVPLVVGWTDRATNLTEAQYKFQTEYLAGIRAGFVNLAKDPNGTVRTTFPGREENGVWRPSLPGALAEALGAPAPRQSFRIDYRVGPDLDTPAFRIFPVEAAGVLPAAWFTGKIVIIGSDLPFEDRHRTPFAAAWGNERGTIAGVLIQTTVMAQLLVGRHRPGTNHALEVIVALTLGLTAIAIALWERSVQLQLAAAALVIALLWGFVAQLYSYTGISLPIIGPSAAFSIGLLGAVTHVSYRRRLQGQFVREAFSRYVSPGVLKKLESHHEGLALGGDKREISVIFTDIEGFTTFAERQEPTVLIGVLNRYLNTMCAEVERFDGMIDKFIGDAVMAIFGAPEPQADHAQRAVACAQAMRAAASRLAAEHAADGFRLGRTRIGVHSGLAVVGNVGGERRFDYTAIGDTVNTASRLEGANKYFGTDICVSGATCERANGTSFRPIGSLVVKGRSEGLPVFTPVTPEEADQTAAYMAAYAKMKAGDPGARVAFEDHLARYPDDRLAQFHLKRMEAGELSERIVLEGK
ncbi:MAG: adenylate/guanylate cyclase domain-containing protein [Proteobacteria bacterium]|nr:adenylate/guanylate cyclase domain-containing protein [Pseudomonadota bacterium]